MHSSNYSSEGTSNLTKCIGAFLLILALLLTACSDPNPTSISSLVTPTVNLPMSFPVKAGDNNVPASIAATPITFKKTGVPRFESDVCPFEFVQDQVDRGTMLCGYLIVPEEHAKPDGKTIRVAIAILRSTNSSPALEPLVDVVGGPGGTVAGDIEEFGLKDYSFGAVLKDRNLVFFEQRGAGSSEPSLYCQELGKESYNKFLQNLTLEEESKLFANAASECRDRLVNQGINLTAYNTAEIAADIHDLRAVFGYSKIDLYGTSYGTKVVLTVMRDFPQDVRSAILDSAVPLQADWLADQAVNHFNTLQKFFGDCNKDVMCNRNYPNLNDAFTEVVNRLNDQPLLVEKGSGNNKSIWVMNGTRFANSFIGQFTAFSNVRWLPGLIYTAKNGDYAFTKYYWVGSNIVESSGLNYSVNCSEEVSFSSVTKVSVAAQVIPQLLRDEFTFSARRDFLICEKWPSKKPNPIDNLPVVSNIPTLILQGDYDPITPPNYGKMASTSLSKSQYLLVPTAGHGVLDTNRDSICPSNIARQFLLDPLKKIDTSCISPAKISFVDPAGVAKFVEQIKQ